MVADKRKKFKVAEEEDSHSSDTELILSVEKLQEVQDEIEKINGEFCDKVLEIEQQYNEIRKPVYVKRNEIIKTIPDFWLTAFLSHPALCDLLTEEDQKIFKYLDSLDLEDLKDVKSGYSITFNFRENPHFEDTKLIKSFSLADEGTMKITGTDIKWKEGMGIVNGKHEMKGSKRPWTDSSFFSWFGEGVQDWVSVLGDEIANIIKEELWPDPLKYFNNETDDEDSDQDEDKEESVASDEDDDKEDGSEEEN